MGHHGRVGLSTVLLCAALGCSAEEPGSGSRTNRPTTTPTTAGAGANPTLPNAGGGAFDNPMSTQPVDHGAGMAPVTTRTGPCVNLQCAQDTCFGTAPTSISGVVYDPAGNNPLYNVAVYVPNEAVQPLPKGATCEKCDALYTGNPIAAALTDSAGRFTLSNAPTGDNIPLVVQVGKWRRQFTIPSVNGCVDNPQPDGMLRLPRNQSEGDIPEIAIATGGADTLECLLRRIGVDATEYVPGAGGAGKVHIFAGSPRGGGGMMMGGGLFGGGGGGPEDVVPNTNPPAPMASAALWNSVESLMAYDIVLLSCEGAETVAMNQQALYDYADRGGRVFASHFHYSWFNTGPYSTENLASWMPGSNDIGDITGTIVTTLPNGQPFPKGQALLEWLGNVGALQGDRLPISEARRNADVMATHIPSTPWILGAPDSPAPNATQYFSFNTPIHLPPDAMYCGRVVYSDLHVGAASGDDPSMPVPMSCAANTLSPQEAALEFMLFDLSSCLTPDDRPPQPPVVK